MLEGLVTWVLNNYVGEYLENLNADQISIALLQGQVELENVPLRKTALRKFDVPLEVKSGIIGKLTLSVPIAHIKSEPWVLKMSDLLILLGPNSDPSSNLDLVEESEQSKKEQMYEELEKLHKQRLLDAASISLQLEEIQNAWWGASLVSAVSNNIQLILNNVHIRYEDDKTMPDKMPFHFGFRIHNISIQTTNSQWKPGFVQPEDGTNTFKKLDVKGFSVFWNCSQEMDVDIDTYEKLKKILAPETSKNNTFILKPFSMTVRMEKNASKFPLKQNPPIPRFTFDLRPERIEIELSKRQLAQIRVLSTEWARFDRARQHRKWRPLTRIVGNAKDWWKFAYGRIAEDNRKQRSTASATFVLKRAKLLNNYCKSYTRKLKAFVADQKAKEAKIKDPNSKVASTSAISPEDSAYMKQIEHDSEFTYNELHLFREIVFRKYLKQIEAEQNGLKESDSAETFEVVSPDSEPSRSKSHDVLSRETSIEPSAQMSTSMYDRKASNTSQTPAPAGEQGPGFYGWLASWFTAGEDPNKKPKEEDINQATFLNMWPQDGNRELPPNLRRVEKRIEEELLDVLSESWDDSTVLRRDNLLAEVVLQLERMIVRFVDDDELTCLGLSRILALDMSTVASRVLLSPREHRTEISLSVMDMSVQRLRVAPQGSPELSRAGSMSDLHEDIEDSLWTGVGVAAMDTEVLFAVGRTKADDNRTDNTISSGERKCEPLLQFFYRRLAPRLNVFHEINATFLPIAVVYDEDALDGLANLFDTDSAFFSHDQSKEKEQEAALKEFEPDNQIFLTVNIPEVQLELRSKRKSPTDEILLCQNSQPFASARLTSVCMGLARTEKFLSRMKLGFDQFELKDLFEKTHWPLLKTVPPNGTITGTKTRSLSLPALTDPQSSRSDSDLFSSSLPTELKGISAISGDLKTARSPNSVVAPSLKRPGLALDNDFGHWDQSCVLLNLIFVDEKHPKFEETYQRQHCTVKANLSEVEVGMNARTWTMLLNFFGALGQKPRHGHHFVHELPTTSEAASDPILEALLYGKKMSEDEILKSEILAEEAKRKASAYNLRLQLDFEDLAVNMNYPANNTQLGQIALQYSELDLKINLNDPEDPMKLQLAIGDFSLSDLTPFYSDKYGQRVEIDRKIRKKLDKDDKITVDVLKFRTDDPELKRRFDIKVDVRTPKELELFYIHTHRYFCALLDFWFNFADLGDQVRRKNEKISECVDGQKTRCKLTVDLASPTQLVLPLNQFSDDLIFLEMDSVRIKNEFLLGSQTKELEEHAIETLHGDDDYDCLLDKMSLKCEKLRVFAGKRLDAFTNRPVGKKHRRIGQEVFEDFLLEIQNENILNRAFDLNIEVFKNLSSFISHNLPELSVLTHFEDLELRFTVEFYKLLRGFLEKNLGDQLIPNPDTIPFEVLQCPDKGLVACTAQKYATFSNRMDFRNVTFHFLNPKEGSPEEFERFGKVLLHKARISFDAYIDNQSELDIICESSELADSRYDDFPANQRPNIFTTIVQPRKKGKISEGNTMALMSEAHIMMKKDEAPVVTLVLMNSRVLLILDWLNMAKDFVLQNSDFQPPEEPTRTNVRIPFAIPKEGILLRNGQNEKKSTKINAHTITLKITLKESDLVLLENSSRPNSLALVGHTTAVLGLHDQSGVFEGNFEVQNIGLSWCLMSAEASTHCQISNEFDLTASLTKEPQPTRKKRLSGLDSLETGKIRQCLSFGLGEMVFRLSYKDILVVQSVLTGALERLAPPKNAGHQRSGSPTSLPMEVTPAPIYIKSIDLTAPNLSVWLLDDSQNVALPLVRLVTSDLKLFHVSEKFDVALRLSVDYFNQRVFGWEPLLEPWQIEKIEVICGIHHNSLKIQPALRSPLNFNVSQSFVQQAKHFSSKWAAIKTALETDLRTMCVRSRSDHLPYILKNETGSNLIFTTAIDEVQRARKEQRKPNAKWFTALTDKSCTFEFPTKLLTVRDRSSDPRSLVIRVEGWDEVSPVSVDSVGTYFRVARLSHSTDENGKSTYGRIVIAVSMEPNGRKVVTVRSALLLVNQLADPVHFSFIQQKERYECDVLPGEKLFAPLRFVGASLLVRPKCANIEKSAELKWSWAKQPGEVTNKLICFSKQEDVHQFWMCVSVKREHYPEAESLCGHSIYLIPTLNVLNLLPTDIELTCNEETHSIQAGDRLQSATVNLEKRLFISVASDKFRTDKPATIQRSSLSERQDGTESCRILLRLFDQNQRELHVYASVSIIRGGAIHISLWVPFWIVNRSGIPLVIKQEAADQEAAGQMSDHESAKDRNPMMFSFSDPDCPSQCVVRIGTQFQREYRPKFSRRFALVPGVQSLQLMLTHDTEATQIYNIGVEVRQGTGRYKDTQVVLLAPRYRLNNQSSYEIYVSHPDEISQPNKQVCLAARSNLIWHESFEDKRMLCAKRLDTIHWSCPFRIDQVGSFHVTMRDRDETPRFVRVEVTLNSASFWVTFTDASFFPAPIQIENRSTVPVLYHQHTESARKHHLRTICKANSIVEYAWDDLYAQKLLTLQVYENKSHTYDPSRPSQGPPLIYENHIYIQFYPSFKRDTHSHHSQNLEDSELVFTCRKEGKVQLTRQNLTDSSHSQLWTFTNENCLENVGFNYRQHQRDKKFVLDVLDNGSVLMMRERDPMRNTTQKWRFTNDGRLRCGLIDRFVEAKGTTLFLSPVQEQQFDEVPKNHRFKKQRQKPGSGVLDVQCLHVGPTLVVRITDRADINLEMPSDSNRKRDSANRRTLTPRNEDDTKTAKPSYSMEVRLEVPAGLGISVVNNQSEELIYALFKGLEFTVMKTDSTYQMTGSVSVIQIDNQLLYAEKWPVLYCEVNALKTEGEVPESPGTFEAPAMRLTKPALKLEMSCNPREHYDAFDCFRVKLCDMCLLLDETLLWKIAQFIQETGTAESVKPKTLIQPPNIEPASISDSHAPTRRCYFGTLELEIGNLALTVLTVAKNGLPRDLRTLKEQFNVKLVSFENALVSLPAFRQLHYFETLNFLVESLSKFYMAEFQKQTMKVIVTMDAFGNPQGLASDLKESFQGLLFEGDVSGFVSGLGYGVTNSISKVASSMAHGVGSLTFDEQHELMRRRMLRSQSQQDSATPLSHLYGGVKGLGVGVFGGLTALAKNTLTATQEDGISGIFRGVTTGAVDTVTKPIQGVFDFLEGSASALKEVVGGPLVRKSHFPERRIRLPRVCTNLQSLLPCYDDQLAEAQQELLRITGYSTNEILLNVVIFFSRIWQGEKEVQKALICSEQCYILRQRNDQPNTVTQRIVYRLLKNVQPTTVQQSGLVKVEITYEDKQRRNSPSHIYCSDREVARQLADRILQAKQRYDHSKRTLTVLEDVDSL